VARKRSSSSFDVSLYIPKDISISPRLITIKQAAAYCSCAVWAIRQFIWSKELPAFKMGKRYVIDRGDLDRLIDARLREHAS
jgi:excisionase family DNA binding protein